MSATSRITDQAETAGSPRRALRAAGPLEAGDGCGRGPGSGRGDAENSRYARIEGIAAYTALTVRHLHDLTRRREIPHIRVGKVVLYDKVAVDEWLSGRQTQPAQLPDWRRPIGAAPARRRTGHGRTR
ncbi:MAG: helix-turn-helix domain-containing protein [Acidimicrobiales bacterium]